MAEDLIPREGDKIVCVKVGKVLRENLYEMAFFYTDNELCFSEQNKEHFYVYRVYGFQEVAKKADLLIIHGSMKELKGKPTTYKAVVNKTED